MIQKAAAAAGWMESKRGGRDVASIGPLPCFKTPLHRRQRKGGHGYFLDCSDIKTWLIPGPKQETEGLVWSNFVKVSLKSQMASLAKAFQYRAGNKMKEKVSHLPLTDIFQECCQHYILPAISSPPSGSIGAKEEERKGGSSEQQASKHSFALLLLLAAAAVKI